MSNSRSPSGSRYYDDEVSVDEEFEVVNNLENQKSTLSREEVQVVREVETELNDEIFKCFSVNDKGLAKHFEVNRITKEMLVDNDGGGDCLVWAALKSLRDLGKLKQGQYDLMFLRTKVIGHLLEQYRRDQSWETLSGITLFDSYKTAYPERNPEDVMIEQMNTHVWLDEIFVMGIALLYDVNVVVYVEDLKDPGKLVIISNDNDPRRDTIRLYNNGRKDESDGTHYQTLPSSFKRANSKEEKDNKEQKEVWNRVKAVAVLKASETFISLSEVHQSEMINVLDSLETHSFQRRVDYLCPPCPTMRELQAIEKSHGSLTGELIKVVKTARDLDLTIHYPNCDRRSEVVMNAIIKRRMFVVDRTRKLLLNFAGESDRNLSVNAFKVEDIPLSGLRDSVIDALLMATCADFGFESAVTSDLVYRALKYLIKTCVVITAQTQEKFKSEKLSTKEYEEIIMSYREDLPEARSTISDWMSMESMLCKALDVNIVELRLKGDQLIKKEHLATVRTNKLATLVVYRGEELVTLLNVRTVEKKLDRTAWRMIYDKIHTAYDVPMRKMKTAIDCDDRCVGAFDKRKYATVVSTPAPIRVLGFPAGSVAKSGIKIVHSPPRDAPLVKERTNVQSKRVPVEMMGYELMDTNEQRAYLSKIRADITSRDLRGELTGYLREEIRNQLQELDSAIDRLDKDLDRASKDLKDREVRHITLHPIVMSSKLSSTNLFFENWLETFLNKAYLQRDWTLMVTVSDRRQANKFYVASLMENVELPLLHAIGSSKELANCEDHLDFIRRIKEFFYSSLAYQSKVLSDLMALSLHRNVNPNEKYNETVIMSVEALASRNNCPTIELVTTMLTRNMCSELREYFQPIWERAKTLSGGVVDDITIYTTAVSNAWVERELHQRPKTRDHRDQRDQRNHRDNREYKDTNNHRYKRERDWGERPYKKVYESKVNVNFTDFVNTLGLDKEKASLLITKAETSHSQKECERDRGEEKKDPSSRSSYDYKANRNNKTYPKQYNRK